MKKTYKNTLPKNMEVESTNVRVENGELIVEVEFKERFEPKDGDFVVSNEGGVFIYNDKPSDEHLCSCYCGEYVGRWKINTEFSDNWTEKEGCRYASPEEKDAFLERLEKECGKKWNAEKKCLEYVRWKPKEGELYYFLDLDFTIGYTEFSNSCVIDRKRVEANNCFRTEEAIKKVADKTKEIFKNSKAE